LTSKTECVQGEQRQQKMTPVTLQASKKFSMGPNDTYEVP